MKMLLNLIPTVKLKLRRVATGSKQPTVIEHRKSLSTVAVVFLHGFSGRAGQTWQSMVKILLEDENVNSWDVYSLAYPSSLRVDVPNLWAADPGLDTLALELSTTLQTGRFDQYRAIALVTHSMGGLIAQRTICDAPEIRKRITHLFLYGSPNAGLKKAAYFSLLKRQLRDLDAESAYVKRLRLDWTTIVGETPPFHLRVIAGDRDEFVPGDSALGPFPSHCQRVVPGDHLSLIAPTDVRHQSYDILAGCLSGREAAQTVVDGAEVALEFRHFNDVIRDLWENRYELDDNAVVTLALALESIGRRQDAIDILEAHYFKRDASDVIGTLAGRLKRRWLAGRVDLDYQKSEELYRRAYKLSVESGDHSQCYYHGINLVFLELMALHADASIPASIILQATKVIEHCMESPDSMWRTAAMAEANLVLGELDEALELYGAAVARAKPRELASLSGQALMVAQRTVGKAGAKQVAEILGLRNR